MNQESVWTNEEDGQQEILNHQARELQSEGTVQHQHHHHYYFKSKSLSLNQSTLPPSCPLPSIPSLSHRSSILSHRSSIDLSSFNHQQQQLHHLNHRSSLHFNNHSTSTHQLHSQSDSSIHHSNSLRSSSKKHSSASLRHHHRLNSYSLSNLMLPYQHSSNPNHPPSLNSLPYSSNLTSISPSPSPINSRQHHSSVSPSKYLLTVIPPESLPSDHPRTSLACTGYGPAQAFRRGTLIPLYPTLSSQKAAIAREYGLPSTGGMVMYLIEGSAFSGEMGKHIAGGPRVGEHAWQMLWSSIFEEEELAAYEADVIARERLLAEQQFHLSQDSDHHQHHHQHHHHRNSNRNQPQSFDEDNSEEILNSHNTCQFRSRSDGFPSHSPSDSFSLPQHSNSFSSQPIESAEDASDPETDIDPICMPTRRRCRGSNQHKNTRGSSLPNETSSASNHLPHKPTLTRLNQIAGHSNLSLKLAPCSCSSMTNNQDLCRHAKGPNSIDSNSSASMDASLRSASFHQSSVPHSPITYTSRPSIDGSHFSAPPDHQTSRNSSRIYPCRSYGTLHHHQRNQSDLFGMRDRASFGDSMSDFSSSSLGKRANRPVGVGVIVGKIEFDIDRRRGNGRWYDQWLEGATFNDLPSSSRPSSAQPSPLYDSLGRPERSQTSDSFGYPQTTGRVPLYLPSLITKRENGRESKLNAATSLQPRNLTPTSASSTSFPSQFAKVAPSTKEYDTPSFYKTEPSPARPSFPVSSLIPVERTRTRTPQHDREATIRSAPKDTPQNQIHDSELEQTAEVSTSEKSDQPEDETSPRSAYSSQGSQHSDKAAYEQLPDDQDRHHPSHSSEEHESSGSHQMMDTNVKKNLDPLAGVFPSDEATWSSFDSGFESGKTGGTFDTTLSAGLGLSYGQLTLVAEEFEEKAEEGPHDVDEVVKILKEKDYRLSFQRPPLAPISVPLSSAPAELKLRSPVRTSSLLSSPINLENRAAPSSPNSSRTLTSPVPLTHPNPLLRSPSQALSTAPSISTASSHAMAGRTVRSSRTFDTSGLALSSGLVPRASQVIYKRSSTADMQADLEDLEKTLAALSPQALKYSPRTSPMATDELLRKLKEKEEMRSLRGKESGEVRQPLPSPSRAAQASSPPSLPLPSKLSQLKLQPQRPHPPSVSFSNSNNLNVKKPNEGNGNLSPINKLFSSSSWNLKRSKVTVVEEPIKSQDKNEKVLTDMMPNNSNSMWGRRRYKSAEDHKQKESQSAKSSWKNPFGGGGGGGNKVKVEDEEDEEMGMEMGDEDDAPEMIRRNREIRSSSNLHLHLHQHPYQNSHSHQHQNHNQRQSSDKKSKRPSASNISLSFRKRMASTN